MQDLTEEARNDAAEYCNKVEQRAAEITSVAAREAEEMRKALKEQEEKNQRMIHDISYLIENLEDLTMNQIRAQLMTIRGDDKISYPEQIKRHPPTTPPVLPFAHIATKTDDEGGPIDRYTHTHTHTHTCLCMP